MIKKGLAVGLFCMLILAIPFSSVGEINSPLITSNTEGDSAVQFKWVDDDGSIWTNADDDGVIPYIPPIEQVPLDIQFQIIKDNNTYFGQENQQQAMENITLSGNALFTGTLDEIPEVTFINSTTWNVPLVPTMALNGGEIIITVTAWNTTITEKLSIGGDNLNGTIVTITPNEFIFGQNLTLIITVTGATGYPYPNAQVYVCYIGDVDGGIPGDPIESHMLDYINGGGNTNGEYTLILNTSQQTVNQTLAGFATVKARRNISAYVKLYVGGPPTYVYGYAKSEMKPGLSELEIEVEGGFPGKIIIRNIGNETAYDVNWSVNITGGIFGYVNYNSKGSLSLPLQAGNEKKVLWLPIGFGRLEITATASAFNAEEVQKTVEGFLLLFFVIIL